MIEVVLITDKNYFKFSLTTIHSLLKSTRSEISITCIITDVSSQDVLKAETFFRKEKIKILKFDDSCFKEIKTKKHVSRAAYIKILLPNILVDKERIIFLDSDLLVRRDISALWDEFNENYMIQAVWNPGYDYDNKICNLDENDETFNTGVMLMNLKKMRDGNITKKLSRFIDEKNHLTKLNDQAAFNAIFANSWGRLDLKWNVQFQFYWKKSGDLKIRLCEKKELLKNPFILHFTSHSKPWMFRNAHPFKYAFKENYFEVNNELLNYNDIIFISALQKLKEFVRICWFRNK